MVFIFLGWFLLSVKKSKSSIILAWIGFVVEKFKKILSTRIVIAVSLLKSQEYIIHLLSEGILLGPVSYKGPVTSV